MLGAPHRAASLAAFLCIALSAPSWGGGEAPGKRSVSIELERGRSSNDVLAQQVGLTIGAAAVSVPASLALAGWVGSLSGSIVLSALPGLLIGTLVPPVAVSLVAWLSGNSVDRGRFSLWPALIATSVASVAATIAAGFLGLNANEPGRVAVFTAVEAAVLPTAALATMHLTAAPGQVTVARFEF